MAKRKIFEDLVEGVGAMKTWLSGLKVSCQHLPSGLIREKDCGGLIECF